MNNHDKRWPSLLPVPQGVSETVSIPADGGIVKRKEGVLRAYPLSWFYRDGQRNG